MGEMLWDAQLGQYGGELVVVRIAHGITGGRAWTGPAVSNKLLDVPLPAPTGGGNNWHMPADPADHDDVDPWPPRHLVLHTPRLDLRPDDDAGLLELVERIYGGIHDPAEMPFGVPWTDAPRDELGRNAMRFFWSQRATLHADDWTLNFLVRLDGRVIGTQGLTGRDFAVVREVHTGSWIGQEFQGKGIGTEMRAAVLRFAFEYLGARTARSDAWLDNLASSGVSRKLGYLPDGTETRSRRGTITIMQRLLVTAERFAEHRPGWAFEVDGFTDELSSLLGA